VPEYWGKVKREEEKEDTEEVKKIVADS